MRVYVPMTLPGLASVLRSGSIGPPPVAAYAVTPAVREWYAGGSDEELEYAALTQAAKASLAQLADASTDSVPPRRVVAACDVDVVSQGAAAVDLGDAQLTLASAVPWVSVAAVHVDAPEAADVVAAAMAAWDAAHNGDEDAMFTVGACEGEELLWYATQEVPDLLNEVGVPVEGPTQRS